VPPRTAKRSLFFAVAVAALLLIPSASAAARTINVFDGEWIQGAVKRAEPGDSIVVHPGIYRQSVQIKKNGLTLEGARATSEGTVIKRSRSTRRCSVGQDGICVLAHRKNNGKSVRTSGTEISGFLIRGFRGSGLFALGAKNTVIRENSFINNGEYGAFALASKRTKFLHNRAKGSDEAGFYVGSSPNARAVLRGNRSRRNGDFGFFLRDAAHGVAINNQVARNCSGIALVNTGEPGGVHDWKVRGNAVLKNQAECPGEPAISGTGIVLLGARGNLVRNNTVVGNRPADPSAIAPGGIVLISSVPFGGTTAANNRIRRNWAFRNEPADIAWDGDGAGNRFFRNRCDTSQPGGLCN
jgi:nitrous oxidase accessory protein NosD